MEFATELIARFAQSGAKIAEIPTVLRPDRRGGQRSQLAPCGMGFATYALLYGHELFLDYSSFYRCNEMTKRYVFPSGKVPPMSFENEEELR